MPDGVITLSKQGERLVENYEFYAAFMSPKEWKVTCDGKEIGQISNDNIPFLTKGNHLLLAGNRWEIIELKHNIQVVIVKKGHGKKKIQFSGGYQDISREIHQRMLEIYETGYIPIYLSPFSTSILIEGFEAYKAFVNTSNSNILSVLEGSKIKNTIRLLLKYCGVEVEDAGIGFLSSQSKGHLIHTLKSINLDNLDKNSVINLIIRELKYRKKFDYLLPDNILNKSYEQQCLDFQGAKEFIEKL